MLRVTEKNVKVVCGLECVLNLLKVNKKDLATMSEEPILLF